MSNRLHHFLQELHGHTHKLRQAIGNDADLKQAAQEAFVFLNAIGEDHLETMVAKDLGRSQSRGRQGRRLAGSRQRGAFGRRGNAAQGEEDRCPRSRRKRLEDHRQEKRGDQALGKAGGAYGLSPFVGRWPPGLWPKTGGFPQETRNRNLWGLGDTMGAHPRWCGTVSTSFRGGRSLSDDRTLRRNTLGGATARKGTTLEETEMGTRQLGDFSPLILDAVESALPETDLRSRRGRP